MASIPNDYNEVHVEKWAQRDLKKLTEMCIQNGMPEGEHVLTWLAQRFEAFAPGGWNWSREVRGCPPQTLVAEYERRNLVAPSHAAMAANLARVERERDELKANPVMTVPAGFKLDPKQLESLRLIQARVTVEGAQGGFLTAASLPDDFGESPMLALRKLEEENKRLKLDLETAESRFRFVCRMADRARAANDREAADSAVLIATAAEQERKRAEAERKRADANERWGPSDEDLLCADEERKP